MATILPLPVFLIVQRQFSVGSLNGSGTKE